MKAKDFKILLKKILVGVAVYLVPVTIVWGGLWFTQRVLSSPKQKSSPACNYPLPKR